MNQIENGCFFIDILSNNSFEQKIRKIAKKGVTIKLIWLSNGPNKPV